MSVSDFMTTELVTVTPDTPIFDAIDLMKKYDIHRLPVLENQKLVGLITEGLIQEAMPSKATSLSVYEINYLVNKTFVKDVMIKQVETIGPDSLLEDAIATMRKKNIGVLPVLDGEALKGVITNNDIFDAFLKITGYNGGGTRVSIQIDHNDKGIIAAITKILAENELSISTIVVNRMEAFIIIEIQVESQETEKIKNLLNTAGYTVTNAVLTNQ